MLIYNVPHYYKPRKYYVAIVSVNTRWLEYYNNSDVINILVSR